MLTLINSVVKLKKLLHSRSKRILAPDPDDVAELSGFHAKLRRILFGRQKNEGGLGGSTANG
jgi:hypothetical protein